jgi:hypothetical protein
MGQQAGAEQLYSRYVYYSCGRPYYGYRAYAAPQAKAYQDNHAVSYQYTINYSQPAALQGQTQYGLSDISSFYGDFDLGAQLNQASRLAEGAQKLAASATSGYGDMLAQTSADRTRIAEILAKGNAAAQALTAANAQSSATIVRQVTGSAEVKTDPPVNSIGSIEAKCLKCHGGEANGGGDVKLPSFGELTAEQADAAMEYVTLQDDRNCADKAHLTGGELKQLVKFLCKKTN